MTTEFLDHLAEQLRARRSAACRRAINRILTAVKSRFDAGDYPGQPEAERDFRARVEAESACREAKPEK
jgi:predicted transcriptional regulator